MKKLLGIVVLGLLLSGNAYSKDKVVLKCDLITDGDNYSQKYSIELNMEKKERVFSVLEEFVKKFLPQTDLV